MTDHDKEQLLITVVRSLIPSFDAEFYTVMTSETQNLKLKIQSLSSAFTDLEDQLAPLFAQPLPETLVELDPIQAAKLQTVLAYVVYDLIFIYLKTKGIDPKTHPVISELDRIKQYFTKIQNAENPPKRATELDKAAASRFIKHAISEAHSQQAQSSQQLLWKKTRAEEDQGDDESSLSETNESTMIKQHNIPPKMTSKMLARQKYETELREQDDNANTDEEDALEVFDQNMDIEDPQPDVKDKGKAKAEPTSMIPPSTVPSKRRRPVMDPFAASGFVGNDEEAEDVIPSAPSRRKSKSAKSDLQSSDASPHPSQSKSHPEKKAKKKKNKKK